jgi:KaiC/GvpD/RAD55 family RecA-like ATPase
MMKMTINRVKSGIEGLDELIQGGFPQGSTILVSGSAGTGKTIFGLQYLYHGAKSNEPGIYLTVEESKENIIDQGAQFGWDLEKLENEGKLIMNVMKESDIEGILDKLKVEAEGIKAKRLVVDSLSMLGMFSRIYSKVTKEIYGPSSGVFPHVGRELSRTDIYYVIKNINSLNTTALIISELPEESKYLSRDTVSEFACDGVILLHYIGIGG